MRIFSPDVAPDPGAPVVVVEWVDHTEMLFADLDVMVVTPTGLLEFPAQGEPC